MQIRGLMALVLVCLLHTGPLQAQRWEMLGPDGGAVAWIAAGSAGNVYVLQGSRIFASSDDGRTWAERPPVPGCTDPTGLQVRNDGDVFVNCSRAKNLRSRDGARSWSFYSPPSANILAEGTLVFDPRDSRRAVVLRALSYVAYTADDGITWTQPVSAPGDAVPSFLAWDSSQPGRLVGVKTEVLFVASHSEYLTRYFESRDNGAHWTPFSVIVPQRPDRGPCYEREFVVDSAGRAYLIADCGFMRSLDGGATWEPVSGVIGSALSGLRLDPANANRLIARSDTGQLYESRDAAATWQSLPPLKQAGDFAASDRGILFAATSDGVFALGSSDGAWTSRDAGLRAQLLRKIEPAGTSNVVLSAIGWPGSFRSLDGGASWTALLLDGRPPAEIARNLTDRSSVFALTDASALYASTDGGATWSQATAYASAGSGERIAGIVPIGPQPGLLYGLYQTCDSGILGCFFTSHGVARSNDGGKTWAHVPGLLPMSVGTLIFQLAVSPSDAGTVMVSTSDGVYVTRDGGGRFEKRGQPYSRVVPDSIEPSRWYAIDTGRKITVTTDAGLSWSALTAPALVSKDFDLLVDPLDTRRLYVVGTYGDVGLSTDRGITWQVVIAPSLSLTLSTGSARAGPETTTTLYAAGAQGALKSTVGTLTAPALVRAIEYYRPSADHYFVTANAQEIAMLDGGAMAGWVRTGFWFNVLSPSASGPGDASPVCRFYGKPEKGLDSHFYSASSAECQSVRDRFSDAWIYESPDVFEAYLPAQSDGLCPERTTPIYRLYNRRADVNHRYTMWPELRQQMIDAGWVSEGYGIYGTAMCAPW